MTRKKTTHRKKASGGSLRIIPFGGLDGIGKNMTLFEYEDSIIIVDCGIMFPSQEMPGIDFLIPDFTYLLKNRAKVKGLFITHGHEDHIGAVPYLLQKLPMPVYGTRLTLGLIRSRLEERLPKAKIELSEIDPTSTVNLGPFTLEFMRVNHSIVDGVALAIKTPLGTIIHTGDFKIDYSPVDNKVADYLPLCRVRRKRGSASSVGFNQCAGAGVHRIGKCAEPRP
jgi:ribonuclease J